MAEPELSVESVAFTPAQLARVILWLHDGYVGFNSDLPEDVADCIDWARTLIDGSECVPMYAPDRPEDGA